MANMIQYSIGTKERITQMSNRLMLRREVADYSGTTPNYVTNQAKTNRLAYLLTSPRRMMFTKSDVDHWMASWKKVEATAR
jgi:hypothetical protein